MLFPYDILQFGQMEYLSHLTDTIDSQKIFFIEVQLLYNVVLVSAIQQSEVSHMDISVPSLGNLPPLNPIPLGHHSTKLSPLCYIAASHQLAILHMAVYICQCCSPNSSHLPLPSICPRVCWLRSSEGTICSYRWDPPMLKTLY